MIYHLYSGHWINLQTFNALKFFDIKCLLAKPCFFYFKVFEFDGKETVRLKTYQKPTELVMSVWVTDFVL